MAQVSDCYEQTSHVASTGCSVRSEEVGEGISRSTRMKPRLGKRWPVQCRTSSTNCLHRGLSNSPPYPMAAPPLCCCCLTDRGSILHLKRRCLVQKRHLLRSAFLKDLRRCLSHKVLERAGQVLLIEIPGLENGVQDRNARLVRGVWRSGRVRFDEPCSASARSNV